MGSGTDVAIESAGVTLLKGDLTGIVRARQLSRATVANIRQNLVFAFMYNVAGIPVAAGVLYLGLRPAAVARDRGRRDGPVLGQRHQQRFATARPAPTDPLAAHHRPGRDHYHLRRPGRVRGSPGRRMTSRQRTRRRSHSCCGGGGVRRRG